MTRTALRIIKIAAIAMVVAGALVAALGYAMIRHFNTPPPAASFPKPANDLDARRQDLAYFRQLIALDRSFAPSARSAAEQQIAGLEASGLAVDSAHFRVALMKILALADNGHTRLDMRDGAHLRQLPVRVGAFADGFYVMRATQASRALLGGRIVSIDAQPIAAVLERLMALRGGTTAWRKLNAALYLSDPKILFGADISRDAQQSVWTVATPDGNITSVTMQAIATSDDEPFAFADRWVSDEPIAGVSDHWLAMHPDRPLPLSLRDFDTAFRRIRLEQSCVMLIQLKANHDVRDQRIKDFLAQTAADMRSNAPCAAIVDLRFDGGGNYQNTAAFAAALPRLTRPQAPIYLLTGPATFSAGITTVGFIKQAGRERVTILGEPVGDRLQFFSEGNRGCLPNSPFCVSYQRGKHDYAHPCTDWDVCFWLNKLYPVQVSSLDPQELLTLSFPQWRQGRDPPFERAVELAGRSTPARH